MSNGPLPTPSLEGIKRQAQRIRRQAHVPHHEALNRAARAAGFENFAHARSRLPSAPSLPLVGRAHDVFITAYWRSDGGDAGRETIVVALQRPLRELLRRAHFSKNRHLLLFRVKADDHIECHEVLAEAQRARERVCGVARVLMFVQATGLEPVNRMLVRPVKTWHSDPLPGCDHPSTWRDPSTNAHVFADEPYSRGIESRHAERNAWAARNGLSLFESAWRGMYAPAIGSRLYLFGRDVGAVERAALALPGLQAGPTAEQWNGESAPYRPVFRSPAEHQANGRPPRDLRRVRPSATSLPYALAVGGPSRRPRGRMPLDAHDEVAAELREATGAAEYRVGVRERLERVRSELDDWVQIEYGADELDQERFSQMYYGERGTPLKRVPLAAETQALIERLARVRSLLSTSYPDCGPLRRLLKSLELAHRSAAAWRTRDQAPPQEAIAD
jgi:hypothetical protein